MYIDLCMDYSLFVYLWRGVYTYIHIYIYTYDYICLSTYLSIYLSINIERERERAREREREGGREGGKEREREWEREQNTEQMSCGVCSKTWSLSGYPNSRGHTETNIRTAVHESKFLLLTLKCGMILVYENTLPHFSRFQVVGIMPDSCIQPHACVGGEYQYLLWSRLAFEEDHLTRTDARSFLWTSGGFAGISTN